jgi:hypothetical protein
MKRIKLKHHLTVLRVDNLELVTNYPYHIYLLNDRGEEITLNYDSTKCDEKLEDYDWIVSNIEGVVGHGIE